MMHCPTFSYSISKDNMILINTSFQLSTTSCNYASESSLVIGLFLVDAILYLR